MSKRKIAEAAPAICVKERDPRSLIDISAWVNGMGGFSIFQFLLFGKSLRECDFVVIREMEIEFLSSFVKIGVRVFLTWKCFRSTAHVRGQTGP
jgi:hypothetical protein